MSWPSTRPLRSRSWALAYGITSMLLGLLPAVAALPALAIVAVGVAGTASPAEATSGALLMVAPATVAYLVTYAALVVVGVRLLGIGMAEGFHPVHSRAGWQVWATERLMGMARTGLFPLYSSQFTAAWLRLLGARIGRDVEASTVIALPKMTTVARRRVPRRRHDGRHLRARPAAGCTWRPRGSASRRSSATPG